MAVPIDFPLGLIQQKLDSGFVLVESLFFPELNRLGRDRKRNIRSLERNLTDLLGKLPQAELYRRRLAIEGSARWLEIDLDPPRKRSDWREPARLRFAVVVWNHGDQALLARIPALAIEVIATDEASLDDQLKREAVAALRRDGDSTRLDALVWRQRATRFRFEFRPHSVTLPSLKQRAIKAEDDSAEEQPSLFKRIATPMLPERMRQAFEADATVSTMAESLTAARPQAVLLIGPSGVGKTAAVREMVRRKADFFAEGASFHQTSGARIVAGQCGFGMWQERCAELVREAAKRKAVVHLGSLVELMEVGKSEHNQTGLAGFLRPAIARGELLCVAECTPEQVPMIEREDPQLVEAFRHVKVEEPDARRGRLILQRVADLPHRRRRGLTPPAIDVVDRLHRRYATYSAFPGRPIRFIDNLRKDGDPSVTATADDVLSAFTRETGLPRVLLDASIPFDVEATRQWFAERVVGQAEATDLVVDLLATIKAGLTRPNRPIASLLFIGPTGVGKTEMAKSLAEFLFGSKDRLTRFDMSEYADPVAVQRLAGTAFGTEGLLTSKVREQPFSVLLLDEFEKAHPSFLDLMLQVLGEARLTDAGGRLADFRNTVIVLTSNLGAASFQSGRPGFAPRGVEQAEAKRHFVREVEKFLRPEMFNRLDRLVPFAPLDAATIGRIAEREWKKVLQRDGIRFRGVKVTAGDEVLPHLAAVGFDARYGARPLKRAIEREVLAPVAHQLNRHNAELAMGVTLGVQGCRIAAGVKPLLDGGRPVAAVRVTGAEAERSLSAVRLRRLHQLLEKSSAVRDLDNEVYQLEQTEKAIHKKQSVGKPLTKSEQLRLAKLGRLREVTTEVRRQREAAFALEDEALLAFHTQAAEPPEFRERLARLRSEWDDLLLMLYRRGRRGSETITVAVYSEDKQKLVDVVEAYANIAKTAGLEVKGLRYVVHGSSVESTRTKLTAAPDDEGIRRQWLMNKLVESRPGEAFQLPLRREWVEFPLDRRLFEDAVGVALEVSGTEAVLRFQAEAGLHHFEATAERTAVLVGVQVHSGEARDYFPPKRIERKGQIETFPILRLYSTDRRTIIDSIHEDPVKWDGDLREGLAEMIRRGMGKTLMSLVLD